MQIILASASKRRQELLSALGLKFRVVISDVDEEKLKNEVKDPKALVKKLALEKALAVKKKIKDKDYLIISADTIVALKNNQQWQILGKAIVRHQAKTMLQLLRGKKHLVLTGLTVISSLGKTKTVVGQTEVYFNNFSQKDLDNYLDKGFYVDRAGAYGIQDEGCRFIKKYVGSYTNILGLPMEQLKLLLKELV